MKNKKIILITLIILTATILIGCQGDNNKNKSNNQIDNNSSTTPKNITMNMYQFGKDQDIKTDLYSYLKINQKTLNESDTVHIKNNISLIYYNQKFNTTNITLCRYIGKLNQSGYCETFRFQGNITNKYQKNDEIIITGTIKHVNFTDNGFSYDLELFEEQWQNETYFNERVNEVTEYQKGYKPMSPTVIRKV